MSRFIALLDSCIPNRANWLLGLDGCLHTLLEILQHVDMEIITVKIKCHYITSYTSAEAPNSKADLCDFTYDVSWTVVINMLTTFPTSH